MTKAKTKYYIQWNETRTEGFITTEREDAASARSGKPSRKRSGPGYGAISSLAAEFFNCYGQDAKWDKKPLPRIQEVEL